MWQAQALQQVLNLPLYLAKSFTQVAIDSRHVLPGSLFVAIRGEKVDGHSFLQEAQKKGAIAAVVHPKYSDQRLGMTLIPSICARTTLQRMAQKVVEIYKPKILAVTGSIGKTSTKDFIYTLIQSSLSVYKTPGNYNSQLTLPLSILNAPQKTDYLLLEMGMDQPGELDRLLKIAPPDLAILTWLAHVHVEPFKTFQNLALEKLKIFGHPNTKWGFFNLDMPFADLARKKGDFEKRTCSLKNPKADYFIESSGHELSLYKNQKFWFRFKNPLQDPKSQVNLLYALAVADTLKVPKEVLMHELTKIDYPEKRMVQKSYQGIFILNDAYNACVESVENALKTLQSQGGRKIAILSEMVEQGVYSLENHQKIARYALETCDILIGFGSQMRVMIPIWRKSGKKWAFFLSYDALFAYVAKLLKKKDALLIKGARKHALERLIDDLITR